MLLGVGAVATKTYVDDVFSTYLYTGNNGTQTINNGIDLASEGGMLWIKPRNQSQDNTIFDTERGITKSLVTNSNATEYTATGATEGLSSFNSNGFTTKLYQNNTGINNSACNNSSWTFRKAPGFFTISSWTGDNDSNRAIPHDLGSIPGMVIVKNTSNSYDWSVWHRDVWNTTNHNSLRLNSTAAASTQNAFYDVSAPTSSNFYVRSNGANVSGQTYVAYVFAGGESTAATARSVDFDGSNDYLYTSTSHSDVSFGTGNFTIELWFRYDGSDLASTNDTLIDTRNGDSGGNGNHGWTLWVRTNGHLALFTSGDDGGGYAVESNTVLSVGKWYHAAITRESNTYRLFLNGVLDDTNTQSSSADAGSNFYIGYKANYPGSSLTYWNGLISNVRILKGTALYTSSFKPPTEPLTNITNTKFLWAQSSTVTTGTVNPMTLTNSGTTASTDSPFDDPAAFTFGENEDQGIIKCGSYVGNGNANGPEINLGWEPQWVMLKRATGPGSGLWLMADSMRGVVNGGNDPYLQANGTNDEYTEYDWIEFTPTGFKLTNTGVSLNASGTTYVYLCIRRPDGYVGKPRTATEVFGFAYGTGTNPAFAPGFPVDFAFLRRPGTTENWTTAARLIQGKYLFTNSNAIEASDTNLEFDHNNGFHDASGLSSYLSWSWRRHKGFEVQCYKGLSANGVRAHNMNTTPQMVWVKNRDQNDGWAVFHKDLDTYPQDKYLRLDTNSNVISSNQWYLPPTSTHWHTAVGGLTNVNGEDYIAMLFASSNDADGNPISKVGTYSGSNSNITLDLGFTPRFFLTKGKSGSNTTFWTMWDSTRGITGGGSATPRIFLNDSQQQTTTNDNVSTTATGITIETGPYYQNQSGYVYVYYAHA